MKWFLLNVGEILIDRIRIPVLQSCSWSLNSNGYIQGSGKYRHKSLHRIIAELAGLDMIDEIDHKDGNPRNNQISNLRSATHSQNGMNRKPNNTFGYKGVTWDKIMQKWHARIKVNGKSIHLGLFDDPEEASEVYKEAAIKYHGEFARV